MKKINIKLLHVHGALERTLRLIRHRGFDVHQCNVRLSADNHYAMTLVVDSRRDENNLMQQLNKQFDVVCVSLTESKVKSAKSKRYRYAYTA
ncbi:MAG: acetolactate synthase 2 small subunit [Gammaproteobacteria bacterium]|nr:acetolactate synthase 2 small subunit [Gammaproteobacteria bacterium]NVK89472.1 acetolactate synthase 2 small subunit [Gammaproteobacteria bacterium]